MLLPVILFYVFSGLTVLSALLVITVKNPVQAVLFLIFGFFNASGLFVLLGAELLAMLLIIVYVGAVAILFLFVVMMLNIHVTRSKEAMLRYLPLGIGIAAILLFEIVFTLYSSTLSLDIKAETVQHAHSLTNVHAIGNVLYTDYMYLFQLSGLILFVAMIAAIVLTHRERSGVRKQKISDQLSRTRADAVDVVKVEIGKGV